MFRASIFSSDVTMTSYYSIIVNIIIVTNPTFSRVLKLFIVFFSHHRFFVRPFFFYHFTAIFSFSDHTTNKIVNWIFSSVFHKRLIKLIINTYQFIAITASNMFFILLPKGLFWILNFGKINPLPPPSPCLKLVRIMLETWNFVRKYTNILTFRDNIF